MFECRACVLRCVRAIAGDAFTQQALLWRKSPLLTSRLPRAHRCASTALAKKNHTTSGLVPGKQPVDRATSGDKDTAKKDADAKKLQKEDAVRNKHPLELELRHLPDRVKLAEHVHHTLRNNDPQKALDLCRLASKRDEVIVAWNHVVDWHMQHNRIDEAIKIYNEMKKRAQFPDSYTYILLLRGLARGHHHGQVVKESNVTKAVAIYNSMFAPASRVPPSVMHTNAVLRVCSAALDMDALWGIAARMPTRGPGAPDHQTYTTLLNAIRHGLYGKNPADVSPEQLTKRRDQAVQEGRRIWQEVIPKWRGGEIHIDEELACAMGRLLLGSRRLGDWDAVLNLVRQTMKIERLIPPVGDASRHTEHVPQDDETLVAPEPEPEEDSEGYSHTPSALAFRPVQPLPAHTAHPKRPTVLPWVKPGNATLSLLLETCTLLRTPKTASAYWSLLTQPPYNLTPDIANFHAHLKLLSKNRASAKAAALLREEMRGAGVEPKNQTFRLAMAACTRDKNNPSVLSHARAVIDVMEATSPDPDIHTLEQYISLVLTSSSGAEIASAITRLDSVVHNLYSRVTYGTEETGRLAPTQHLSEKEAILGFFQILVGAMDTLMNRGLVPREEYAGWHARRSQMTGFIGRARVGVERLRRKVEEGGLGRSENGVGEGSKKMKDGEAREGMRMSKGEWALRTLRWKGRREKTKAVAARREKEGEWKGKENGKVDADGRSTGGFADSPMELSGRG